MNIVAGTIRSTATVRADEHSESGPAGPLAGVVGFARLRRVRRVAQWGQATAEYALVLLGVALIAMLVLSWARDTNMISRLLNTVFRSISKLIT